MNKSHLKNGVAFKRLLRRLGVEVVQFIGYNIKRRRKGSQSPTEALFLHAPKNPPLKREALWGSLLKTPEDRHVIAIEFDAVNQ